MVWRLFYGDADITAYMDTWSVPKAEIAFACGGGIHTSAAEAAVKTGGKIIGGTLTSPQPLMSMRRRSDRDICDERSAGNH